MDTISPIYSIQVNKNGNLFLVAVNNEPNAIRRYLFDGTSWIKSAQSLTHNYNSQFIRRIQFAQSDTKLMIHDCSNYKVYIAQIINSTYTQVLSINPSVSWTNYKPERSELSDDQKFISCFYYYGHQYTNYMINWQNNTYLSIAKQADNNSFYPLDTLIDCNQIYTVVDYTNFKVIRYQLLVNGSTFTYQFLDSVQIPNNPWSMVSQSSSKFQIVSTFNSSIYLLKETCSNTMINCMSCAKLNTSKCVFCSQQYLLQNDECLNCAPGYYKVGSICTLCSITFCKTCTSTTCSQCMTGYALSNDSCASCSIGYYNLSNKCLSCVSNCLNCVSSSGCLTCAPGYFIDGNICSKCLTGCSQCLNAVSCTNCSSGYVSLNSVCCATGTSVCNSNGTSTSCSNRYYLSSQRCVACLNNCETCSDGISCANCSVGWQSVAGQICNFCDLKYYLNRNSCLPCSANCNECSDSATCTTCFTGYKVSQGKCDSCQDGYFLFSNECQPCNSNCSTCNDSTNCLTCKDSSKTLASGCTVTFNPTTGNSTTNSSTQNSTLVKLSVTKLSDQYVDKSVIEMIPNCQIYQLIQQDYSCKQCKLDSEKRFNVFRNGASSSQCVLKSVIENSGSRCTAYQVINSTHTCSSCRQYYRLLPLNVNGTTIITCIYKHLVIITPYCERYTWNVQQKTHVCQKCEDPNDSLVPLLIGKTTSLTCVMTLLVFQIPNCYSYRYSIGRFYCLACNTGYVFDISKKCNECAANYTKSISSGKVLCTQN